MPLLDSFPVGKVRQLELFPLCFEEFVDGGRPAAPPGGVSRTAARAGGAPGALAAPARLLLRRGHARGGCALVSMRRAPSGSGPKGSPASTASLVTGYRRDFGKYAGRLPAQHIDAVFSNVPRQLAASGDGSVQRFRFRNVIERKRRYRELRGPIDWLEAARLVRKVPSRQRPAEPAAPGAGATRTSFKLYLFDVGLLGAHARPSPTPTSTRRTSPSRATSRRTSSQTELMRPRGIPHVRMGAGAGRKSSSCTAPRDGRDRPGRGQERQPHPRPQPAFLHRPIRAPPRHQARRRPRRVRRRARRGLALVLTPSTCANL